jgi:hypothetical protein
MRRLFQFSLCIAACWFAEYMARATEIQVPQQAVAGAEVSLSANSPGTLYLFGPGTAIKKSLKSRESLRLALKQAGHYTAIMDDGSAATFEVASSGVTEVAFLARPSRVPADRKQVISGTVFLFDAEHNLVIVPTPVKFDLAVAGGAPQSRNVQAKDGVAYVKMDSGRKAGAAQFVASAGKASIRRVVQQTAADPCNLRMHAQQDRNGVLLETDPIHDCAGNPVPDGTIVTFTAVGEKGRSTVDARIKKGVARAQLPPMQNATFSVAAGVVVGNEVRWGGGM